MIDELIKMSIKDLKPYIPNKEKYLYKLDANESPYSLPKEVMDRFVNRLYQTNLNYYPDSDSMKLKETIANYLGVSSSNLVVGNGSDEMIRLIMDTFIESGDVIVSHSPTFSMYGITGQIIGARYIDVPSDSNFDVDISKIIELANKEKSKLIFLCSPNNPTGNIIPKEEILRVINETKSIVVVDEAYIEFGGESVLNELENNERLIVLRTLSKAFGLAGIRIGYLVSNKKMIDLISKVKPPYNLNTMTQLLAEEVLKSFKLIESNIRNLKTERERLYVELSKLEGIDVNKSYANFLLIKSSYGSLGEKLVENGFLIRQFSQENLKGYSRVTVSTKEVNDKFLNLIKEVISVERDDRI